MKPIALPMCAAVLSLGAGACSDPSPPNVVLLVVDTLRADMVFTGSGSASTPNLDSLAREGVVFTSAFSHAPMTLPSHSALFSSRPPFETGVLNNFQSVRDDLPLFAEWIQSLGYRTHGVVSLGTLYPRGGEAGLSRGFDTYETDYWQMNQAPRAVERMRATLDLIRQEELDAAAADPPEEVRPFFLFAHFTDPHAPYNAHSDQQLLARVQLDGEVLDEPTTSDMTQWDRELELGAGRHVLEFDCPRPFTLHTLQWTKDGNYIELNWEEGAIRESGKRVKISIELAEPATTRLAFWISQAVRGGFSVTKQRYIGEVEWMDAYIGEFLDELRQRGWYDNTLIVFTADHGEAFGEHESGGHVEHLYDEMIHVPLLIKPPKRDKRSKLVLDKQKEQLVPHQDLAPTILDLIGAPTIPDARGTSILRERNPLLIAQTHKPEAKRNLLCLRDSRFKLIFDPDEDTFEMYDLLADPFERVDVFTNRRGEREEWVGQLRAIAELVKSGAVLDGELDEETRANLEALGYGGNSE